MVKKGGFPGTGKDSCSSLLGKLTFSYSGFHKRDFGMLALLRGSRAVMCENGHPLINRGHVWQGCFCFFHY